MKTKIYTTLFFALIFLFAQFISSCQKDTPCVHNTTEEDIPLGDIATVPYTDATKLTFVRTSTNDTFTFTGQGWITDFGTTQSQGPGVDCYQIYKLQRKRIAFISPIYPKPITLTFQYYSYSGNAYLEIDFNNQSYILFPLSTSFPNYDSLIIQQKTYYKIRYFKNQYHPEYNTAYGCYYNITQGILRMETSDGDKWELIKVE